MPANTAAHLATRLETSSRMQPTPVAAGSVAQRQTCISMNRIRHQLAQISTVPALASRHPLMSTNLDARRLQSGVIIGNIGDVAATVSQKILA